MRGAGEDHGDLGDPPPEPLAGAQVERDSAPTPVMHLEGDRRKGFCGRIRVVALLLVEAEDLFAALPARPVHAASGGVLDGLGEGRRFEHLDLLLPQRRRGEVDRFLHGDKRHELDEVILDDVAGRADPVVVSRAASEADVLGHRYLHVVDVIAVPHGFEQLVGEAQRHDVLDGFLAQVVVDAEHRLLGEHRGDDVIELACTLEVVAERFLDDDTAPRIMPGLGDAGAVELPAHHREIVRRNRQVERDVPGGLAGRTELVEGLGEAVEALVAVERAGHEPQPLGEALPHVLAELGARAFLRALLGEFREFLVIPFPAPETDERESRRQQTSVGEVVDRRNELLARQVPGDSEDYYPARPRDAR